MNSNIAILKDATRIDLRNAERGKYFRVVADGRSVADELLRQGLAVHYDGGTKTKSWCE